jgi:DNA-binding transcriptional MerR regulator/methylmalonyl-CoA mutase cobalamin-binding subunit
MNYTVKAAARATGVSESRLRTWERRYGIPNPGRAATGRRLYSEEDLEVVRRMATLVEAGMSAAQAAEAAKSGVVEELVPERPEHELAAVIARAAESYDEASAVKAIRSAVNELGWDGALVEVIFPALNRVGLYWQTAALAPASEHFVSELVRRELLAAISALPAPSSEAPSILLACPEEERHDLGLAGLSLLLRRAGIQTIYLGSDVPASDIMQSWDVAKPDAICLSATSGEGLASLIRASRLITAGRRPLLFVGGPSVVNGTEAIGIKLPASINDAAGMIVERLNQG